MRRLNRCLQNIFWNHQFTFNKWLQQKRNDKFNKSEQKISQIFKKIFEKMEKFQYVFRTQLETQIINFLKNSLIHPSIPL